MVSARAICSSYLPEWRPGTDYRRTYAALAGAGGVKLDLIHELDYLLTRFGLPERSCLLDGQLSHLELKSVDGAPNITAIPYANAIIDFVLKADANLSSR